MRHPYREMDLRTPAPVRPQRRGLVQKLAFWWFKRNFKKATLNNGLRWATIDVTCYRGRAYSGRVVIVEGGR